MPEITGLGHVGLYCHDLGTMRDFYARVLGLTISDEDLERGICFLSAAPDTLNVVYDQITQGRSYVEALGGEA